MSNDASKLIKDLGNVPNIVGGLGLAIAQAQKAFNLDYLNNLERILALIKVMLGEQKLAADGETSEPMSEDDKAKLANFQDFIKSMISQLAPPRYQYTETTLNVKLDLAQTTDIGGSVGLGAGFGAITVNAAFSLAYGFDYRAAAECRTVIHAHSADQTAFQALLNRAKELGEKAIELPPAADVDDKVIDQSRQLFEKMLDLQAPKTTKKP